MTKTKRRRTIVPIENPATKRGLNIVKITERNGYWFAYGGKSKFHN